MSQQILHNLTLACQLCYPSVWAWLDWQLSKSDIHWQLSHDHLAGSNERPVLLPIHISWYNMSHLPIQHKSETICASQIKVNWQLSKWDMCTIRRLITWAQVRSGTRSGISPPLKAGRRRTEMSYTRSWLSVNTNITIFAILMKVNWQLSNYSIRWPSSPDCIAGSFIYPLRSRIFLKFSSDVLFDHGLNSVFWAKPHSLENLFGNNVTVHQPPDLPSVRTTGIPMFNFTLLASLGACNLILYIHVLINWQLPKQWIRWPVSSDRIAAQVATHLVWVFFKVIRWQVATFRMIAGSSSILVKCLWKSRVYEPYF